MTTIVLDAAGRLGARPIPAVPQALIRQVAESLPDGSCASVSSALLPAVRLAVLQRPPHQHPRMFDHAPRWAPGRAPSAHLARFLERAASAKLQPCLILDLARRSALLRNRIRCSVLSTLRTQPSCNQCT